MTTVEILDRLGELVDVWDEWALEPVEEEAVREARELLAVLRERCNGRRAA